MHCMMYSKASESVLTTASTWIQYRNTNPSHIMEYLALCLNPEIRNSRDTSKRTSDYKESMVQKWYCTSLLHRHLFHQTSIKRNRIILQEAKDLEQLSTKKGKVFESPSGLLPASRAQRWPALTVSTRLRGECVLEKPAYGVRAQLILAAYRAGAEPFLKNWRLRFADSFASNPSVGLCELSVVEASVRLPANQCFCFQY